MWTIFDYPEVEDRLPANAPSMIRAYGELLARWGRRNVIVKHVVLWPNMSRVTDLSPK